MKLSEQEAVIFSHAQHRASDSAPAIAKSSSRKVHTIRYCLKRLEERGLINRYCFLDLCPLGFQEYVFYVSLSSVDAKTRKLFVNYIKHADCVPFMIEVGGEFEYAISIVAKSIFTVSRFLKALGEQYGNLVANKSLTQRTSWIVYGKKYLTSKKFRVVPFLSKITEKQIKVDELDIKLMEELSTNSSSSNRELANVLGIPSSTVDFRLARLREQGIIVGFGYSLNVRALGIQAYRLLIYTKGLHPNLDEKMQSFCRQHLLICALVECLGTWDYEIVAESQDAQEIVALGQELREKFGDSIEQVKLLASLRVVKHSVYCLSEYLK